MTSPVVEDRIIGTICRMYDSVAELVLGTSLRRYFERAWVQIASLS